MKKINPSVKIDFEAHITLTEVEARALSVLSHYGDKNFLEAFYEKLGIHYLKPHEAGIISLLKAINAQLPQQLSAIDDARKALAQGLNEKPIYIIAKKRTG